MRNEQLSEKGHRLSRRNFIRSCAATAALVSAPVLESWSTTTSRARQAGPAHRTLPLDQGWLFGGKLNPSALEPDFDDTAFSAITLPHCVVPLSWENWDPSAWEDTWIYRRHFTVPSDLSGLRYFLDFDRVMAAATPVINGHTLAQHLGGYLPFQYEVTKLLREQGNVLAVAVDSRWTNAPPSGSPRGPISVDYMLPGGINGSIHLRAVPSIFIRYVFARPENVLDASRRLDVTCTLDADSAFPQAVRLVADLQENGRTVATASKSATMDKPSLEVSLSIADLANIVLWDVERPHLYDLIVTLFVGDKPMHNHRTRVGFREARFEVDGFFLNGRRLQIFGLDRHELYPYIGYAAPPRLLRRDAEILRRDFNCNMVRCSHYPQSAAFLDACDELGLMVWEELPGWQYIGDEAWQELAVRDVGDMVRRDRNRPSVIIWGVRINESRNDPALYSRTRELAKSLDPTRPTSGTMTPSSKKNWQQEWHQDVFAFDDYHAVAPDVVGIDKPLPGIPYLITEAVGQFNYNTGKGFTSIYRRAGDPALQQEQALMHAQAHNNAANYPHCSGVIAWCAFEYASPMNAYHNVKCPGVSDVFRIPKLGASFYMAQVEPHIRPVIQPSFYWDFGSHTPAGPGSKAAIFSNCDRLELFIHGKQHAVLHPDRAGFPHLKIPAVLCGPEHGRNRQPRASYRWICGGPAGALAVLFFGPLGRPALTARR